MNCVVTRGAANTPCRGTFTIRGDFRDSGPVRQSQSRDSGDGATIRGTLRGARGSLLLSAGETAVSHFRKRCAYVTGFSLRSGTGRYMGYRGGTSKDACSKLAVKTGTIRHIEKFNARLTKRG